MLHQLVGYVLLDYEGEHPITEAGFYLSRQGTLERLRLSELLGELSGDPDVDLTEARGAFRQVAAKAADHGDPPHPATNTT